MAMNPTDATATNGPGSREHQLPCGRTVEVLWAELESGYNSRHTEGCPHCTTAHASLTQLMEATRLLVDDPVEPPTGMLGRIMDAVRSDLAHTSMVPLPGPDGSPADKGEIDISTLALAAVLRYAIDGIDGIRAQRCRVESEAGQPYTVRVAISVSLRYSHPSGRVELLEQARERVRIALSDQIGLRLAVLNLEAADVWVDESQVQR